MSKKLIKRTYVVQGRRRASFEKAAAAAVDLALESGVAVAVSECDESGRVLGLVVVQASTEQPT